MKKLYAFFSGFIVGILGGLLGLGGAEYRLPLLVGYFGFALVQAIIINLAISLFTVLFSLIFRNATIPVSDLVAHYDAILNLLAGSTIGAWIGVTITAKISDSFLHFIVWLLLLTLGCFMIIHAITEFPPLVLSSTIRLIAGFGSGILIGVVSSMLGVAGGELIIPVLILLYSLDIKLAGSISLCVSLPTILTGLYKYRQNKAFPALKANKPFIMIMTAGSILGAFAGSIFLDTVKGRALQIVLGIILMVSAIKTYLDNKDK